MFTRIDADTAEGSSGFRVQVTSVHELQYIERDLIVSVEIEGAIDTAGKDYFLIYPQKTRTLAGPKDQPPMSDQKREEILRSIDAALTFLGIPHKLVD